MTTVLFAHGDPELRDLSVRLLSPYGYEVETAGGGVECLGKLRRRVPDLLVLELDLPWGGGDGVLGVVGEDPRLRPGRVVVTSAVACNIHTGLLAPPPNPKVLSVPPQLSSAPDSAESEPPCRLGAASGAEPSAALK